MIALAAETGLISERIKDAKRNLHRANKHQGGALRPFGYKFGGCDAVVGQSAGLVVPDALGLVTIFAHRVQSCRC